MRIYEGDYAYEVERVLNSATQVPKGWRYNVYRVRPLDEPLRSGETETKEAAEAAGKRVLAEFVRAEQRENKRVA